MPTPCDLQTLCERVSCQGADIDKLWDEVFGNSKRVFIATGNIGIPSAYDSVNDTAKYAVDVVDYTRGAALINSIPSNGIFLVGGMDYDRINISDFDVGTGLNILPSGDYNPIAQESKIISGFSAAFAERRLYPVMGNYDFWPATGWAYTPEGDITAKMARTNLHMFNYLPDAKRYYSIYDDESNTEFFILSSGRYSDYFKTVANGFIYPNDSLIGGDQHTWFTQKCSSSPAKNKVVIFACPFVSPVNTFDGIDVLGAANVFSDFSLWDFTGLGVKLIINGHSGNSFHMHRGSMNIVNASAFSRSRFGLIESGAGEDPPYAPSNYGQAGWIFDYFSYRPVGFAADGVEIPDVGHTIDDFLIPRNEFFKMTCTKEGIDCEFISYNPALTEFSDVIDSMNVEHSFYITSN